MGQDDQPVRLETPGEEPAELVLDEVDRACRDRVRVELVKAWVLQRVGRKDARSVGDGRRQYAVSLPVVVEDRQVRTDRTPQDGGLDGDLDRLGRRSRVLRNDVQRDTVAGEGE